MDSLWTSFAFTLLAAVSLTLCPQSASATGALNVAPARLRRVAVVDERYESYNVEMAEVVGAKFCSEKFPQHERRLADCGDDRDDDVVRVVEPAVAFAFIENILERTKTNSEKRNTDRVQSRRRRCLGIAKEHEDEQRRDDAGNDVDEEHPTPTRVIS